MREALQSANGNLDFAGCRRVGADAQSNASFSMVVPNPPTHQVVTATAWLLGGLGNSDQTSEYALDIPITELQDAIFASDFE